MIGTSLLFSGSIGGLLTPFDSVAPTAGYSLRNLGLSYSGAVVRVRKDITGNPEQDFTAGQITNGTLSDFLETLGTDAHSQSISTQFEDVSDVSLICACNTGGTDELDAFDALYENGFVSKWYDQFGSNDATQTTATDQPKIWDASTGLVAENGKPALDFDGVDDYLINANGILNNATDVFSSVVFSKSVQVTGTAELIFSCPSGDSSNRGFDIRIPNSTEIQLAIQTNPSNTASNAIGVFNYSTGNANLVTGTFNASLSSNEQKIYGNGSLVAQASNSGTSIRNNGANGGILIGKFGQPNTFGELLEGSISELIIYNTDQSANRTAIEDNINNYYDIY